MHTLFDNLKLRDWIVRESADQRPFLPKAIAHRYPLLPSEIVEFLSSVEECRNTANNVWFLTARDYTGEADSDFRWNECECMGLENADGPNETKAIISFWDLHFPFMLAVHSDYDYLAVRLSSDGFGNIVHGYAPEWENPSIIAPSFKAFLEAFNIASVTPQPEYPLDIFLQK